MRNPYLHSYFGWGDLRSEEKDPLLSHTCWRQKCNEVSYLGGRPPNVYLLMFSVMALATSRFWWWGWRIIIAIHLLRGNKHLTFFLNHLSRKAQPLSEGEHQLFIPNSATIPDTHWFQGKGSTIQCSLWANSAQIFDFGELQQVISHS